MSPSSPHPPGPGPLAGLRVVELAGIGPGPFACHLLHDLGAEVVRVARPAAAPVPDSLGQGRPTLVADLKSPQDLARVLDLLDGADVLVEGFRPGTTERLGLGPQVCLERNPRLVYARMTGWGQHGPLADRAGHDINYLSLTGALHAIGEQGRPPVPPLNLVADFGGGSLFLVTGVLAALLERQRSGRGQVVDAAMVDGASYLMLLCYGMLGQGLWTDRRGANLLDGGCPFYRTYQCADGGYVAVGALEPQFYAELLRVTGLADRADLPDREDQRRWPELACAFAEVFRTRSRDDWATRAAGTDACLTPVLSLAEAPRHPHLQARGTFTATAQGPLPAPAPRLDRTPPQRRDSSAAPPW